MQSARAIAGPIALGVYGDRMRYLLMTIVIASCADGSTLSETPKKTDAERAWRDDVLPVMEASCISCHSVPAVDGIATNPFLAGNNGWQIRDALLGSGIVDIATPQTSFLLTKGAHMGPALSVDEMRLIIDWLAAEAR